MSDKKIIIICILMVVFLALSSYYHSRRTGREEGGIAYPEEEKTVMLEKDSFSMESFFEEVDRMYKSSEYGALYEEREKVEEIEDLKEIEYKKFSDPGSAIELEYPSHWKPGLTDNIETRHERIDILLTTFWGDAADVKTGMIVLKGRDFADIESFIKETETFFEEGSSRDILEEKEAERGKILDTEYQEDIGKIRGRERIMSINNETYLISVFVLSELWEEFYEEVDHIINSVSVKDDI